MLVPASGQPARFAQNGELFAHFVLDKRVCGDTTEGRLVLFNVNSVILLPVSTDDDKQSTVVSCSLSALLCCRLRCFLHFVSNNNY